MMKRFGMLVLGLCFLGAGAMAAKTEMEMPGPAAFDPRIDEPGEFWKTTNETFVTPKDRPFFRWNKSGPDGEAHHPAYADGPKLSFLGLRVYEANVGFTGGLVKDVKLSFYNRGDVLYASIHQEGLYPGTGTIDEVGVDAGMGQNINIPLPRGARPD